MQKEVIKNMNKNYLRMECDAVPETNQYEYRMMNVDSIEGLLPCHIRFINGSAYLYYDISATNSFAEVFSERNITGADMEKLAKGIRDTMKSLEKHLLESENLVFDPELIFLDSQTEDIYFIYYPYFAQKVGTNFMKLAEFLTIHVDHEKEELVDKVYRLYEKADVCSDKLPLGEIFCFMEDDTEKIMELIEKRKEYNERHPEIQAKADEQIIPFKEEPPSLSLFEYRKGKIREKKIAYAVEEQPLEENYEKK